MSTFRRGQAGGNRISQELVLAFFLKMQGMGTRVKRRSQSQSLYCSGALPFDWIT